MLNDSLSRLESISEDSKALAVSLAASLARLDALDARDAAQTKAAKKEPRMWHLGNDVWTAQAPACPECGIGRLDVNCNCDFCGC